VESLPGAGATFRVSLPLVRAGVAAEGAEEAEARGSGRVLLAEDEPAVARFAARALTRAGYTVTCCRDGVEALRTFSAAPDAVDVLVTDVAMPGLTGDALARAVHATRPALPVVLVTGFSHTVSIETARALGATLLQKPVSARDLARAVQAALEGGTAAP
jgi:CheY-like chemotaxis protein